MPCTFSLFITPFLTLPNPSQTWGLWDLYSLTDLKLEAGSRGIPQALWSLLAEGNLGISKLYPLVK
jgi:hypothetical protein